MIPDLYHLFKKVIRASIAMCLSLCVLLTAFTNSAEALQSRLSGDYVEDTIYVARQLQDTIEIPTESENYSTVEDEALGLINEYISKYRPRRQINDRVSFTTMQTALNSLAGHYKNFSTSPLPEKLKNRLSSELDKAQATVTKER